MLALSASEEASRMQSPSQTANGMDTSSSSTLHFAATANCGGRPVTAGAAPASTAGGVSNNNAPSPSGHSTTSSKWDRLNYLRGKIEGSGAAQRAKHALIEKYAIFCTIDTVDGSNINSVGTALLEPSLSALINRQRKRSVGPNANPNANANGGTSPSTLGRSPGTLPSRRTPNTTPGTLPNKNGGSGTSSPLSKGFPAAPLQIATTTNILSTFSSTSTSLVGSPQPAEKRSPSHNSSSITSRPNFDYNYTFFLLPKTIVRKDNVPSKQMMVMPMCPTEVSATAFNSLAFCPKGQCEYGHLLSGSKNQMVNLSDKKILRNVVGNITVRDGHSVFDLAPSEITEHTAGSLFACYLQNKSRLEDLRSLGAVSHDLCPRYRSKNQTCDFGPRCLRIHAKKRMGAKAPVDALTPLEEVLVLGAAADAHRTSSNAAAVGPSSLPTDMGVDSGNGNSPCEQQHASEEELVQAFMAESGLRTVGDLCRLSEETFGFMIARYEKRPELAPILSRVGALWRCEDRQMALALAVMCFPGVTNADADAIPPSLSTVGQLIDARPKDVAACGLTMNGLEACLQIRARNRDDNEPLYKQIALVDLPKNAFLVRMTEEVCKFRANAHASWRKQDATRPIVTSLITYVDPATCRCKATATSAQASMVTPSLGISGGQDHYAPTATPGGSGGNSNRHTIENCSVESHPWATHWCRCPRQFERAVNYELSTPSGSRCSEQNCLGMLASKMLPTDAIREVFVHGSHHNGEDPNPLFPCGVCENMLRRVGKDINKKTGGQLLIFMFSAVENPRKLVWLPVTEISHREGAVFKRFLEEEVRL